MSTWRKSYLILCLEGNKNCVSHGSVYASGIFRLINLMYAISTVFKLMLTEVNTLANHNHSSKPIQSQRKYMQAARHGGKTLWANCQVYMYQAREGGTQAPSPEQRLVISRAYTVYTCTCFKFLVVHRIASLCPL